MRREVIPWHLFFESITKQPDDRLLEVWLAKWYFDDNGVLLHPSLVNPWEEMLPKVENTKRFRLHH